MISKAELERQLTGVRSRHNDLYTSLYDLDKRFDALVDYLELTIKAAPPYRVIKKKGGQGIMHSHPDLAGLARECSNCKTIVHFDIKGRSPVEVRCPLCDHKFTIQKYKRGERPKAKEISKDA